MVLRARDCLRWPAAYDRDYTLRVKRRLTSLILVWLAIRVVLRHLISKVSANFATLAHGKSGYARNRVSQPGVLGICAAKYVDT